MSEKDSEIFGEIFDLLVTLLPENATKLRYVRKFYGDDDVGGSAIYFDENGEKLTKLGGDPFERMDRAMEAYLAVDKLLAKMNQNDGKLKKNNYFSITVNRGGTYEAEFIYDPELDKRREAEIRASIGDKEYERLERERKEKAQALVKGESVESDVVKEKAETESPTLDDILDYLAARAKEAAPAGWHSIKIEFGPGEPRTDGKKSISLAQYYQPHEDANYEPVDVKEPLAVIKAIELMRALMSEQGRPWERITYFITPGRIDYEWS